MRILLCSHVFAPDVGGIETVSRVLAEQFSRMGSTVTVVTQTPGLPSSTEYDVVRQPSPGNLRALARKSDLIFQSGISLRTLLPLLFCGKPIAITHHGPLARNGRRGWQEYFKLSLLPLCHNIAISQAIAGELPVKSTVIGDPFESQEFNDPGTAAREKDIVFLGRVVPEKGCRLALHALALLKADGLCPSFTVIGDGSEMPVLRKLSAELGIADQVDFRGLLLHGRGCEVARHKIMLIPSVWAEPFGLVALEGLAAGCVLAASSDGGLPEAVGGCGLLFPNSDVPAMAAALKRLLTDAPLRQKLLSGRDRHLERFQPQTAARHYLVYFESVLARRSG